MKRLAHFRRLYSQSHRILHGQLTPGERDAPRGDAPFHFRIAWAGWPKRGWRAVDSLPPPFSDLTPRGISVGDDALIASHNFLGANDGVGAWATKQNGRAPLWSRLLLHFWAAAIDTDDGTDGSAAPRLLQSAYDITKEGLAKGGWLGTTTTSLARLVNNGAVAELEVTHLGDSKIMLIRPVAQEPIVFQTAEQWHFFDCPRQLGTNSPDTPLVNAVVTRMAVKEGDVVVAMTDGVTDNLWGHEVASIVAEREESNSNGDSVEDTALSIVTAARNVAKDPFALSPFMERAVEEGLAAEGGKLDDISVVVARVVRV